MIFTARPKVGTGATCPSCYADCAKSATTNERGEFEIRGYDPSLLFRVAGLAAHCEARFVADVDPAAGPLTIARSPRPSLPDDAARVVCGRLVDPEAAPVVGAIVSPGLELAQPNGVLKQFGPLAPTISGPDSVFVLILPRPAPAAFVLLEARGLARAVTRIVTGLEDKTLTLGRGAAVRAHVVRNGAPVGGVTMGLAQVSHNAETFLGEYTAVTDQAGRVLFSNICPNDSLVFYGKMQGFSDGGFVAARPIETHGDGSVVDLGDVEAEPGLSLEGRVVLSNGKAAPVGTEVGGLP
jgi:hypothetical protein